MSAQKGSVAVIGAGDYIGGAIAKKFASEGYSVYVGRRDADQLEGLINDIREAGGVAKGRGLDARKPEDVRAFLSEAEAIAPLDLVIFNIGANVQYPILDTTDRVFQKVWEMACFAGFIAGREAARIMLPRKKGKIFFTGATAGLRGGIGYAAFASAKFGLRAVAQSMARELWPQHIHVAHLIIDSAVDTKWVRQIIEQRQGKEALDNIDPDRLMPPSAVADTYWELFKQMPSAWTFEQEIRPYGEVW